MVGFLFSSRFVKFKSITKTTYRNVNVRIYSQKEVTEKKVPTILYIHGNMRAFGEIDLYDIYLEKFAKKTNMKIISVDYKLPPVAPFSQQLDECLAVMEFILKGANNLRIDLNRFIIAGDSEGGQLAIALSQKIYEKQKFVPKLQVLIYPSTQMFNLRLPSSIKYGTGIVSAAGISTGKLALWNLGIKNANESMEESLTKNDHVTLTSNDKLPRFENYLNLVRIASKHKTDNSLYKSYKMEKKENMSEIFKRNKKFSKRVKNVFERTMSPGLVDSELLMNAPSSYFVVCGMDGLRDEQLLYAERLKSVRRPVEIAYYENGFHGMVPLVDTRWGFKLSKKILQDLIVFIKKNI